MSESPDPIHGISTFLRDSLVQTVATVAAAGIIGVVAVVYPRYGLGAAVITSICLLAVTVGVIFALQRAHSARRSKPILADPDKRQSLISYLQGERSSLVTALAPGSLDLRVEDIVGSDGLFISPPWSQYGGRVEPSGLVTFLMASVNQGKRILVLGEAGQGKTTVLKRMFVLLADEFVKKPISSLPFPIYIALRDFSVWEGSGIQLLWNQIRDRFPLPLEDWAALVRDRKVILLLDGFDEIKGELTQKAINERATSDAFTYCTLLTCRKSFYELYLASSQIQERFAPKIELLPLRLTDAAVSQYVKAFCQKKSAVAGKRATRQPDEIINTIETSTELRDLAKRPLFLVMILDTFTDPEEMKSQAWSVARLYERYTQKWLKNEAAKPDSVLKWHDKSALVEELAWFDYVTRGSGSSPFGLYQSVTITRDQIVTVVRRFASDYPKVDLDQIVEDICLRSFLNANDDDEYYFLHRSIEEYFVAKYVFDSLQGTTQSADASVQTMRVLHPAEISAFLRDMMSPLELSGVQRSIIAERLMLAYSRNQDDSNPQVIARENASYYLAYLETSDSIQFLEEALTREPSKLVIRGMMVGLALFADRPDVLDQYLEMLYKDPEASSINIGYHLVHYGDQPLEEGYLDKGGARCEGSVRALLRHLEREQYRNVWPLDMLTLRILLETRGRDILVTDEQFMPSLRKFLAQVRAGDRDTVRTEKEKLQRVMWKEDLV